MAIRSGFFNSINGDRKYDASKFAEYFASFIGNGVFPNPSTNLQVVAQTTPDMTVIARPGKAWINGYILINDDDYILQLGPADGVLNRIDRIVARYDTVDREIRLEVKKGTFASSPVAPTLQRDADAYELALADIYIAKGAVSITQANITDLRLNSELCGIVHGVVDRIDTNTLFNQYLSWYQQTTEQADADLETMKQQFQAEFDAWFAGVKDFIDEILDENTALNLLNLINQVESDLALHKADYEYKINQVESDLASHKADYEYQTPIIDGTQIQLQKQSDTKILKFKLDTDLSGGEITISLDEGATSKPLVDIDGVAVTELPKGFVEVVEDAVNFTYAPKGKRGKDEFIEIHDSNIYKVAESDDYGGHIYALAYDGTYLYVGGGLTQRVWKINPTDMSKVAESVSYGGSIYALAYDGIYLYVGGETTQRVWKINPTDMSKVAESVSYGGSIYALAYDGTYLYVGGETTQRVWKINPTDMSKVAESVSYGGTIRALAYDGTYLYVGGETTQRVWKINPTDMSKVAESVSYGGTIRALAYDGTYLYVGGETTRRVWKINPTDMSKVSESDNVGGNIYALAYDGTYLYVGRGLTQSGKVWKINPTDMSNVSESNDYGGTIYALAYDGIYLYAGGTILSGDRKVWKLLASYYIKDV